MGGTYTSDKRVVKNGVLVAFEGQTMTMDEAVSLGLVRKSDSKEPNGAVTEKTTRTGTGKATAKTTAQKPAK